MINSENVATELFNKIRSRFENVSLGDEKSQATSDPENARFFNFDYISKDGENFGNITISIVDGVNLKLYFSKKISTELSDEQQQEWFSFLKFSQK